MPYLLYQSFFPYHPFPPLSDTLSLSLIYTHTHAHTPFHTHTHHSSARTPLPFWSIFDFFFSAPGGVWKWLSLKGNVWSRKPWVRRKNGRIKWLTRGAHLTFLPSFHAWRFHISQQRLVLLKSLATKRFRPIAPIPQPQNQREGNMKTKEQVAWTEDHV